MHAAIEARMNTNIAKVRTYNTLFDIGLTAVETITTKTGAQQSEASFQVDSNANANYKYTIICYDNDASVMAITCDNVGGTGDRIAHLSIELLTGGIVSINEAYYSLPRSMRNEVQNIFNEVYDLIEEAEIPIKDEEET
jgi:hypothetical protein